MFFRKNKSFISAIDRFLVEFNGSHKPSAAQQAEIDKYSRINELRDNPQTKDEGDSELWEEF